MKNNVSEASAEIMGAPDLHIRSGSQLKIVCTIRHSTEPPSYVFWYHEDRMINHDPGVNVIYGRTASSLVLQNADSGHSGNYTCSPSNAIPAYVNVHVLNATEGWSLFILLSVYVMYLGSKRVKQKPRDRVYLRLAVKCHLYLHAI